MGQTRRSIAGLSFAFLIAAGGCGGTGAAGAGGSGSSTGGTSGGSSGGTSGSSTGGTSTGGTSTGGTSTGGTSTGGTSTGGTSTGGTSSGGAIGTQTGGASGSSSGGATPGTGGVTGSGGAASGGTAAGGKGGGGGQAAASGTGGQAGGPGVGGGIVVSGCVGGKAWPTANPTAAGPFEVAADKNVGPLAGYTPDPIYGDQQQRFNIYRPKNLANSGYCHPILVWANGHTDNPEPNPPLCVVGNGKWCGQYLPMMNHLASHGFVVIASLSTTTSRGEPLPTIAGLNWLLQQAETSSSPYYHRLDTANIGQLGHSEGGMSTCMVASEPRYKALATICGTRALTGVHPPMLFFCGGKDTVVKCDGVRDVFLTVKDQPAFFINELNADHGSWVYQKANGVSLSMAAAWFRVHLMGDTANRKYFYGPSCTFCTDSRVKAEQNSLMTQ